MTIASTKEMGVKHRAISGKSGKDQCSSNCSVSVARSTQRPFSK
jgi:hypothetical protein